MDQSEPIYERIGNLVAECIDDDWTSALLICKAGDDWIDLRFEYRRPDEGEQRYIDLFDMDDERESIENAFFELRDIYKAMPSGPWGTAVFKLTSDGAFEIDYSYEEPE